MSLESWLREVAGEAARNVTARVTVRVAARRETKRGRTPRLAQRGAEALEPRFFLTGTPVAFQPQHTFAAPGVPFAIATADVNADGKPDLVFTNSAAGNVGVLLGNGDGTFQAQLTFSTGSGSLPLFVVVSDVNGDGKPDLLVANYNAGTLGVLLGNGNGTFQTEQTFATSIKPTTIAVSDLNGDGKPDVAVTNYGSNTVGVLLGNGNGTFQTQQTLSTGSNSAPATVAIYDVNGDGKPDLVVANPHSNAVGVLLGNGNGTFQTQQTFSTGAGSAPFFVTVADVNSDGKGDLVVANFGVPSVGVLLGNGNGTFQVQQTFAASSPYAATVADVNGDGRPDLVVANHAGNDAVEVLLGNGNGTFQAQRFFFTGAYQRFAAVSDVNGDGRLDLIVASRTADDIGVLLGDPPPVVQSINRTTPAGPNDTATSVTYTVTFNKAVTGVDPTDFSLVLGGTVSTAPIVVAGGPSVYTVTVNGIAGAGSLGLNLVNDGSIQDSLGLSLGAAGTFGTQQTFSTGGRPVSVTVADLNGDGRPDVIAANYTSNTVSVLLGSGSGAFGTQHTFDTDSHPDSVAVSDVNRDGKADLVVADKGGSTVSVLLGNGNGTFAMYQTFSTGSSPYSVVVSDVNGDGKADVVVANSASNTVSVLLGNGDGTFAAQQTFSTGVIPKFVAVSDVNGDGKPDLIVANLASNTVSVLLGNGNGTFAGQQTFATGSGPRSVAVSDVNGDGKPDLIIATSGSHPLSVLLGNGDGTFAAHQTLSTGSGPTSIALSDLNGDGKPDLVVANSNNTISVIRGDGSGSFGAQQTMYVSSNPYAVAVADANGDGKADLLVANSFSNTIGLLLGGPSGNFVGQIYAVLPPVFQPQQSFRVGTSSVFVTVSDLNGDGNADLIVANRDSNDVGVLLGNGDGTFAAQQTFATGTNPYSVAVADINGDGKPDLIAANRVSNNVSVLLGTGNGAFAAQQTLAAGNSPFSVAVSDVNGDGKPDLVVANGNYTLSVLLGNGTGNFAAQQTFYGGSGGFVAISDVNGDGKADLVVDQGTNAVGVLLGNGNGTFAAEKTFSTGAGPAAVVVSDFNADGKPDLVVANYGSNTVSLLTGNGDGTFSAQQTFAAGPGPIAVAVADVNGDGKPDLVIANRRTDTMGVLLGGSGNFAAPQTFAINGIPLSIAASDVNGDGRADVAVCCFTGSVSVFLGDPPPTVQSINRATPTGPTTSAASVTYTVTFSKPVTGVDPTDFALTLAGGVIATSPVVVSGSGAVYTVTINGISGAGTLGLNLVNDQSIQDALGSPLGPVGNFQAQQTFASGPSQFAVATGDLNGDGKADLVTANIGSDTVSVLLGTGTGAFGTLQSYSAGAGPISVAIADVNGDGKADLVVANFNSNTVGVLLGNGNGTFQAQQTSATDTHPRSVAVADVNGDGKLDLLVANQGSNTVGVLLGNGNGTFQTQQTFSTGSGPVCVAVADVNGDGKPDLLVANYNIGSSVGVLLGNGNGTFQAQQTFATGYNPLSVAVSDVNGDGKPDLILANETSNTVSVLLGNGNGTFANQQTFATGSSPRFVAVSDVNGDGKPDLVVANASSDDVSVLLGNGSGTFAPQETFATGSGPVYVAAADANDDGKPDLIVANNKSNNVSVLLGDPTGNFTGQSYTIDHSPVITSNGGGDTASVSIPENTTAVTTVTATDPDPGQTLTYSISGGADAAKFQMISGVLSFIAAPGFENPTDVGADNVYNVNVQVSDGAGGTDSQAIAVSVTDVNAPPTFTPGPDVTVNEDSGAVTIPGWATGISAGEPGESGQTLTFTVTGITPANSAQQTQWAGYGGGPQHQAISSIPSQPFDAIRWSTPVDLDPQFSGNDLYIHYGTPLITQANTVIVPVKTGASDGFEINAFNGTNGALLWSQASDYTLPPHDWTPSYSPALAAGNRIYFAGAAGTVYWRDSVDSATPTSSGQIAFYGSANYSGNPSAYNSSIHISTPLTADAAGNIYFGFQADGTNPLGITDGFARIAPDGTAVYTSVSTVTGGAFNHAVTNAAPALSLDGQHLYVVASSGLGTFAVGDLLELDSATLAPHASVALIDPSSRQSAYLPDIGTASPMVGPDGDVYFGVLEDPFPANNDRGWMLHFSGDLSQTKTPGAFGWDDTASVVPAFMVPSYHGNSSYLIMTKYNNYADPGLNGDGVNRIAILDPNATETDSITGATVMNEVETIAGVTPDTEFLPTHPNAVREWCINTAVVDPATDSILANSEDGKLYRWDLATNTFTQVITLTPGVGEAYTPTLIGADGTVYAINDAMLYAVGYSQHDLNSALFSVPPSVDPATGNLTFTPAPDAFGTAQITLSLMDNGGTANGGVDTTTHTFNIIVQPVNDAPTLDGISDPAVLPVNSGQQTIAIGGISAGPANELTQSLTVTATSDNPALIPNPTINYIPFHTDGTLSYTPVSGASGSAVITVTVQDNGGTANGGVNTFSQTFNVTVAGPDLAVTLSDGGITLAGGTTLSNSLNYHNNGITGSTGVVLSETLPANTTFDSSASTPGWSLTSGSTYVYSVGTLSPGGAGGPVLFAVDLTTPVAAGTSIMDSATITDDGANGADANTANNSPVDTYALPAFVSTSLSVSGGAGAAIPGKPITYNFVVRNDGIADVSGINVADLLPASIDPFSVVYSASDNGLGATGYTASGSGAINDTVSLPAGSSISYSITGNILSSQSGNLTTTASGTVPAGIVNSEANVNGSTVANQSSSTVTLAPAVELGVVMNGANPLHVGQQDVYTLVVTNFQTIAVGSDAAGATISTDALAQFIGIHFSTSVLYTPDNAVTPTFTTASGTVTNGAVFSDTFSLSSGSIIEFQITGTVAAGATGTIANTSTVADPGFDVDPSNNSSSVTAAVATVNLGSVVGRSLFYGNSFWDNTVSNPSFSKTPDTALAPDKLALMPGQKARFSNYSSYTQGINGIFVDITGDTGSIALSDFNFVVGNDNTPTLWSAAPTPSSISLYPGAGVNGSDRVQINWANGVIVDKWLQVTVLANNLDTNLAVPDVFYFGNAPGEVGNSVTDAFVNASDDIAARNDVHTTVSDPATLANPHDYNRDSKVNGTDEIFDRGHHTNGGNGIFLITPSTPGVFVVNGAAATLAAVPAKPKAVLHAASNAISTMMASLAAVPAAVAGNAFDNPSQDGIEIPNLTGLSDDPRIQGRHAHRNGGAGSPEIHVVTRVTTLKTSPATLRVDDSRAIRRQSWENDRR